MMENEYILLFKPFRPKDTDPSNPAMLMPILVHDDGRQLTLTRVVDSVEKALSMHAGFELHAWVEQAGGFDAIEKMVQERDQEDDDGVRPSEE